MEHLLDADFENSGLDLSKETFSRFRHAYAAGASFCRFPDCPRVDVAFATRPDRDKHELAHFPRLQCTEAHWDWRGKGFRTKRLLDSHVQKYHPGADNLTIPASSTRPHPVMGTKINNVYDRRPEEMPTDADEFPYGDGFDFDRFLSGDLVYNMRDGDDPFLMQETNKPGAANVSVSNVQDMTDQNQYHQNFRQGLRPDLLPDPSVHDHEPKSSEYDDMALGPLSPIDPVVLAQLQAQIAEDEYQNHNGHKFESTGLANNVDATQPQQQQYDPVAHGFADHHPNSDFNDEHTDYTRQRSAYAFN